MLELMHHSALCLASKYAIIWLEPSSKDRHGGGPSVGEVWIRRRLSEGDALRFDVSNV